MILYRYFSLTHGLDTLQTGRWKIGRFAALNDPSDCRPRLVNVPIGPPDREDFEREFLAHLEGGWGLLCYSKTISDPVLWSHYADSHRGLALGFDFTPTNWHPFQVRYSPETPVIDFNSIPAKRSASPEALMSHIFESGYTTKSPSWAYEAEFRNLINLDACNMIGPHYFRGIPGSFLKEVVLGVRCPMTMRDISRVLRPNREAIDPSSHHNPTYPDDVLIRQCRTTDSSFELSFETFTPPIREDDPPNEVTGQCKPEGE